MKNGDIRFPVPPPTVVSEIVFVKIERRLSNGEVCHGERAMPVVTMHKPIGEHCADMIAKLREETNALIAKGH